MAADIDIFVDEFVIRSVTRSMSVLERSGIGMFLLVAATRYIIYNSVVLLNHYSYQSFSLLGGLNMARCLMGNA